MQQSGYAINRTPTLLHFHNFIVLTTTLQNNGCTAAAENVVGFISAGV